MLNSQKYKKTGWLKKLAVNRTSHSYFLILPLLLCCHFLLPASLFAVERDSLPPIRAAQIDLDYVYDNDLQQQDINLALLVERVKNLGINTVFLQAFADPDGNGVAESLYFPNLLMPVKGDLFAVAAKRLRENGVAVYGWLPLLAFKLPEENPQLYVHRDNGSGTNELADKTDLRLSPFNKRAREIIERIYRDFASRTVVDGILFHDDGKMSDFEDSSPAAIQHYRLIGLPPSITAIRADRSLMRKWSRYKTNYLIDFSVSLLDLVKQIQPWVRSARNIYANPVLNPKSEEWFAQSLPGFMRAYDYTALMAMPFMEGANKPEQWLENLAWAALELVENKNRLIFELQSRKWRDNIPVAPMTMLSQIMLLADLGATSFAYYPDDFHRNMPPAEMIRSCFASPEPCTGRREP